MYIVSSKDAKAKKREVALNLKEWVGQSMLQLHFHNPSDIVQINSFSHHDNCFADFCFF